jgi:hypothetical protein
MTRGTSAHNEGPMKEEEMADIQRRVTEFYGRASGDVG